MRTGSAHHVGSLHHLDPRFRVLGKLAVNPGQVLDKAVVIAFASKALQAQQRMSSQSDHFGFFFRHCRKRSGLHSRIANARGDTGQGIVASLLLRSQSDLFASRFS
jgi:hypothetical protein